MDSTNWIIEFHEGIAGIDFNATSYKTMEKKWRALFSQAYV